MKKGKESKPHIGIFGRRNAGKSSIINVLTGQNVAIVSPHPGTTTDPVKKSVEIFGIGPVVMIDTAGIDDSGDLGSQRVKKSREIINAIDMAILVLSENRFNHYEEQLLDAFYEMGVPCLFVHNKEDQQPLEKGLEELINEKSGQRVIEFSALHPVRFEEFVNAIRQTMPATAYRKQSLLGDFLRRNDIVMLIVPIDTEAPEGRLILPQVQVIRDILDNNCVAIVLKESEVDAFLHNTGIKPRMAICDSSIFEKADALVPPDIQLTGFSILLAYYKGEFDSYLKGTPAISSLKDNDHVLILESCTHHVTCDDIGRVKIPQWLGNFTGKKLRFDVVAGLNKLNRPVSDYALVVQCGGCMITRKQLINRLKPALDRGIPVTNYGMAIAWMQGVYDRAIEPFTYKNRDK
ncbi:MAG: [FeFe] hydrogenase H-cluster maturation GTPase HydF [Bacteroidales bacterium]|nr:[FeFe] hydrogenase H-cluster maturation GTPase HydF [Bacteroidales bacterium]MBN2764236.1 [FeFe] hydrogenase H-cluster maturation GTPase HydF [Bacteroidales bacterium]